MSYTQWDFPNTHFYETDLRELIAKCGSYDEVINELDAWIKTNEPRMDAIEIFQKALESGELPSGVKKGIYDWCSENLINLVGSVITSVFFEVNSDGYFVAYIPDSWDDITFYTTEYDLYPTEYEYGHLVISY